MSEKHDVLDNSLRGVLVDTGALGVDDMHKGRARGTAVSHDNGDSVLAVLLVELVDLAEKTLLTQACLLYTSDAADE